ncbi:MAG: Ryanodine receptor Ryr [Paludibacteraceae bacterium]|nr:Ryanodine receptor Ryr [Paludibacteraceae bacterium]
MKPKYNPQPIDTKDIQLPDEVNALVEIVAKNVHEVWAKSRIEQGWTYGEKRDEQQKMHPGILPYEELSESEKDYDRNTAMETLRLVTKLGFVIKK